MNKQAIKKIIISIFMLAIFASSNFIGFADGSYQLSDNDEFKVNDEDYEHLNWNCRELGTWQKPYRDPLDLIIYQHQSTVLAYVICDVGGLLIIDVTTVSKPRVLAQLFDDKDIISLHLSGEHVFLGTSSKFFVLDLDNPYEPNIVCEYTILENSHILIMDYYENLLFLGTAYQGILIYDLSDFLNPTLVYQFDKTIYSYSTKFHINNDILYVSVELFFHIINISSPTNPFVLSSFEIDGWGISFDIQDELLVIALFSQGFTTYNITDLANPIKIGYYWDSEKNVVGVHIIGNLIFLICHNYGLWVINFTETFQLTSVNELRTNGLYFRNQIENNYLYVIDLTLGLTIIDVSTPYDTITISSILSFGGYYTDIMVNSGAAFITAGQNGLTVLSTRNPNNVQEAGTFVESACHYESVFVKGDFAYVYDRNVAALKVINVKRPDRMYLTYEDVIYDEEMFPGYSYGEIIVSNDKLFLATTTYYYGDRFLIIYDLTNPDQPNQLGNITLAQNSCNSIAVVDHFIYIPTYTGVYVYDYQNISNIQQVAIIYESTNDVFVEDKILYCATDDGFAIYDVSNYENPIEITSFSTSSFNYHGCEEIFYMNDRVYVLDRDDGLLIVNIEDKQQPTLEGRFYEIEDPYHIGNEYFGANLKDVYVSNNIVFLACGIDGIKILSLKRFPIGFLTDFYGLTIGLGVTVGLLVVMATGFIVGKRIRRRRMG